MIFLKLNSKYLLIFLLICLLSACSSNDSVGKTSSSNNFKVQPFGVGETPNIPIPGKTGKPYVVRGDTYHPLLSAEGFLEEGKASWYGPNFHGKQTASGEIYNQNAMTAAHKYLPMGTYVYVTNLENGKTVHLKVNDRGPYKYNRVIDVSKKAAQTLGFLDTGLADVRVSVDRNPRPPRNASRNNQITGDLSSNAPSTAIAPLEILGGAVYVDLMSAKDRNEVSKANKVLDDLGVTSRTHNGRLQAGPFVSVSVADRMLAILKSRFPSAYVVK